MTNTLTFDDDIYFNYDFVNKQQKSYNFYMDNYSLRIDP